MNQYRKYNTALGWGAFAIASLTYILTMEPTASLWDCAEFIATSYKLEVGHPPGAPLFMMIARFFTIFAPSPEQAAWMVNLMSSLCGGFTVLFLFWSITHLARKLIRKPLEQFTRGEMWTVLGAGLIGSLAYCFTDTQWFSAVEGEVYSMSSMFTAMVFWAMLQWENVADEPRSNRWLILIAYLMGLSIGIHILNLLTIPALVFIYYFRKYKNITGWGMVKATLAAVVILGAINFIIIPYSVSIAAWVDRIFVNGIGLPINSGMLFFVVAIFALCGWGVWYTHKKGKVLANTVILCISVILLGYGSYASVVIRASANPPMNSNNPSDPYSLLSLLQREQYGSKPLLYGQYYSSPPIASTERTAWYLGDDGKYKESTILTGYEFPSEFMTLFPRMYDSKRAQDYISWGNVVGRRIPYQGEVITVPTGGENLRFFFSYQLNYMYWRYFLWNFVGRQNDVQGNGELTNGNWLSGIKFIDQLYLGPQDDLPVEMADNKARNTYFFLPFILGLIGLIFHLNRDRRNFAVVMWLFLMMGIVLVLYFNTAPSEPRERDYAYAGSFYAFCIWIGLGVVCIREWLEKLARNNSLVTAIAATVVCSSVPVILAGQNWDDHDRSHRYVARDIGWNYLQSCLPNAIIMNYADNDTFPLWFNQEVEGVRPDVRVMNTSYLGGSWYIDQMKIKANESDPVPFSLPRSKYVDGNDFIYVEDIFEGPVDIREVIEIVKSEEPVTKGFIGGKSVDFIPARQLALPVNKENAIASGIVKPEDAHLMVDTVYLRIDQQGIYKNDLMLLDLLANFDWKRPLYITQTATLAPFGLRDYLQFDGYGYRIVPIRTPYESPIAAGRIDTELLYKNLMETFRYGNVSDPRVYADYFTRNNLNAAYARTAFARLAMQLVAEGDSTRAIEVLDAGVEKLPFSQLGYSYAMTVPVIQAYYLAGATEKANAILEEYAGLLQQNVTYFSRFRGEKASLVHSEFNTNGQLLLALRDLAYDYGQDQIVDSIEDFLVAGERSQAI